MSYKNIDGLMRHLRSNHVAISGSKEKRQLLNTGYFHGYKGYRFFGTSGNKLPFTSYEEVYATIQYDSKLKALFYDKMMYIETAVKNISLDCILTQANSESIQVICDKLMSSYINAPATATPEQKKKYQVHKLQLQSTIQSYLSRAYKEGNPKICHFYNNMSYSEVPIWALVEIMTLGDFGFMLSCLDYNTRDAISKRLGLNLSCDTNRELIYKYIYALKDLRNAIAHNAVIFDTRFRGSDPSRPMTQCLVQEIGLPYVNFKTLGDYLILVCYYLQMLKVPKTEIKTFIREFEKITEEYKNSVNASISNIVIHPDLSSRINILRNYL